MAPCETEPTEEAALAASRDDATARAACGEPAATASAASDNNTDKNLKKDDASEEAATIVIKDEVDWPEFRLRWPTEDDRTSSGNDGVDGGITIITSRCLM